MLDVSARSPRDPAVTMSLSPDIGWTSAGHWPDIDWTFTGHLLDIPWTSPGRPLDSVRRRGPTRARARPRWPVRRPGNRPGAPPWPPPPPARAPPDGPRVIALLRGELRAAPVIDDRSAEEIVGYGAKGLPK